MCTLNILNRTNNGLLFYCTHSSLYNLSFNNLTFNFDAVEFDRFRVYLNSIDSAYWEKEYENSIYEKKIPIPTLQNNFIILLNRHELEELKILVDFSHRARLLDPEEINYKMIYN